MHIFALRAGWSEVAFFIAYETFVFRLFVYRCGLFFWTFVCFMPGSLAIKAKFFLILIVCIILPLNLCLWPFLLIIWLVLPFDLWLWAFFLIFFIIVVDIVIVIIIIIMVAVVVSIMVTYIIIVLNLVVLLFRTIRDCMSRIFAKKTYKPRLNSILR